MISDKNNRHCPARLVEKWLKQDEKPRLETNSYSKSSLCIMETRYDFPDFGTSEISAGNMFAVGISLRGHPAHEIFTNGRHMAVRDVRRGSARFYDFSQKIVGSTRHPFHSLLFLLPRDFTIDLAAELETSPIERLGVCPSISVMDPHLARMGLLALPYLHGAGEMEPLKADHFMLYYGTYICARYGGMATGRRNRGGLKRWQERLAAEFIETHLVGNISLKTIANLCGLGPSQFAHAFKKSFGIAPYQHLMQSRLNRAKELLGGGTASLAEIALTCGFSDQSHFTRAFRKAEGLTPGAWRIAHGRLQERSRCWNHSKIFLE